MVVATSRAKDLAEDLIAWLMEIEDRIDEMMRQNIIAEMERGVTPKRWIRARRSDIPRLLNGKPTT